jgi:hypothetical protein
MFIPSIRPVRTYCTCILAGVQSGGHSRLDGEAGDRACGVDPSVIPSHMFRALACLLRRTQDRSERASVCVCSYEFVFFLFPVMFTRNTLLPFQKKGGIHTSQAFTFGLWSTSRGVRG